MPLDPKIIREAQAAYRQWNEAELHERLLTAPNRPAGEAWRQFLDANRQRTVADLHDEIDRLCAEQGELVRPTKRKKKGAGPP